jgi:hypothetical protein
MRRENTARRELGQGLGLKKRPGNVLRCELVTLCKAHGRMKFVRAAKEDVRVVPEPILGRETLPRNRHVGLVGDLLDKSAQ